MIDKDGRPLRRAILWNDVRSAPDSLAIIEALGGPARTAELIGSLPLAAFTVTSWAWLRRVEPELVKQVAGVRLPHDWLTERLTGNAVTDRGDVSGYLALSGGSVTWRARRGRQAEGRAASPPRTMNRGRRRGTANAGARRCMM